MMTLRKSEMDLISLLLLAVLFCAALGLGVSGCAAAREFDETHDRQCLAGCAVNCAANCEALCRKSPTEPPTAPTPDPSSP